jgi:hypothetical protein
MLAASHMCGGGKFIAAISFTNLAYAATRFYSLAPLAMRTPAVGFARCGSKTHLR